MATIMTRADVIAALVDKGTPQDKAVMYADVFCEYTAASANIEANGLVVSHPRTGAPMTNPFLPIRDKALAKLQSMRDVKAGFLWS